MSTKAIREVLEQVKGFSPHAADVRRAEEALRQVEAIEKACRVIDEFGVVNSMRLPEDQDDDEVDAAADFLCAIGRPAES